MERIKNDLRNRGANHKFIPLLLMESYDAACHRLIKDFEKLSLLKENTGVKRNRIFIFEDYIKIFER